MTDPTSDVQAAFPGAEVMVDVASRESVVDLTRGEQAKMRASVKKCRACDVDGVAGVREGDRLPPLYPVHRAPYVVVVGRLDAGKDIGLLRTAMRSAGLVVDAAAWVPVVACRTVGDDGEPRRANRAEKQNCWGHVVDGIWHANTDRVLLVGGDAKDLWRPDLTMQQASGLVGVLWDRFVCMVVDNPGGVLYAQGREKRDLARRLNEHMGVWREVVGEDEGQWVEGVDKPRIPVTRHMGLECVECRGEVDWMDRDGIGWCKGHRNERWMECRGFDPDHGVQGELL